MPLGQLMVACFFVGLLGLLAAKGGQRLRGFVATFFLAGFMLVNLFGLLRIASTILLFLHVGPSSLSSEGVHIRHTGRDFIELTDGRRYEGFTYFVLWVVPMLPIWGAMFALEIWMLSKLHRFLSVRYPSYAARVRPFIEAARARKT